MKKIYIFLLLGIALLSFVNSHRISAQDMSKKDTWHDQTFRKLFFDYHNHKNNWGLAEDFNAAEWAERLRNADVEGVSVFAKCAQGWRYYRKGEVGWVHPELPEGLDMLGEQVEECHKRGIRVIAYYHNFGQKNLEELHPEWMSVNAKGVRNGFCMNTPLTDQFILPQVKEIVRYYDIDGIFFDGTTLHQCFCNDCKADFRSTTGLEIPLSKTDPSWLSYMKWLNGKTTMLHDKFMKAVHSEKPDLPVSFNWAYTQRQPEIVPAEVGYLMCDIFPDDQLFAGSYLGKYWATLGKSFDIMNSAFNRWWGDWGIKPAVAMQQECATILANGGKTWLGYMMPAQFGAEQAVLDEMGKTMRFIKEREEFCRNSDPVPNIAVLHSTHQLYSKEPGQYLDEKPLYSIHKMLVQGGYHYNFVNEKNLLETIEDYKLVILPDQRYISSDLAAALEKFVRDGGGLIATVSTGTLDDDYKETGKFVLEDLLGVRLSGKYPYTNSYVVIKEQSLKQGTLDMPHQVWGDVVYVRPITARPVAGLWNVYMRRDSDYYQGGSSPVGKDSGYPFVTINTFGKGKAAYISGDIFRSYTIRNNWNIKKMFGNIIDEVIPETLVRLESPGTIEVVLKRQGDATQVHLVNLTGERPLAGTIAYTENVIPQTGIGLRVKVDRKPSSVMLMPENVKLAWKQDKNGMISIRVPELDIYSIVVIR